MEWVVYFLISVNEYRMSGIRHATTPEACLVVGARELLAFREKYGADPHVFQVTCIPNKKD